MSTSIIVGTSAIKVVIMRVFSAANRNEAKRFVTLIDALYERKVRLVASAAVEPQELYRSGDGSFEFERTVSRLMEMQSAEYLDAHTS